MELNLDTTNGPSVSMREGAVVSLLSPSGSHSLDRRRSSALTEGELRHYEAIDDIVQDRDHNQFPNYGGVFDHRIGDLRGSILLTIIPPTSPQGLIFLKCKIF